MEPQINYRDPNFFKEITYLLKYRLHANLAFNSILESLFERLHKSQWDNINSEVLLSFGKIAFDKDFMNHNSVSYLKRVGPQSRLVLDTVERLRFELRLLEDENFEIEYETIAIYLEFICESYTKLQEMESVYKDGLKYLMN